MNPFRLVLITASIVQQKPSDTLTMLECSKDRASLAREGSLLALLRVQSSGIMWSRRKTHGSPAFVFWGTLQGRALEQFHEAMQDLIRKPKLERSRKILSKALVWTLDKDDVDQILSKVERLRKPWSGFLCRRITLYSYKKLKMTLRRW